MEFFLENSEKTHINGLAKKLKISPSTANHYLAEYEKAGFLEKSKEKRAGRQLTQKGKLFMEDFAKWMN